MDKQSLESLIERNEEESFRLEFKADLRSERGELDTWYGGGKLERPAKKAILKEDGGFANADGGLLLLGMAEDGATPPKAQSLNPIPRCQELKSRITDLIRSAFEPSVPKVDIEAIEIDGDSGVVAIEVLPSIYTPIRDTLNKECYSRIGDTNYPMSMAQIRDSIIQSLTRGSEIDQKLRTASERFDSVLRTAWVPDKGECPAGVRGGRFRVPCFEANCFSQNRGAVLEKLCLPVGDTGCTPCHRAISTSVRSPMRASRRTSNFNVALKRCLFPIISLSCIMGRYRS